MFFFIKDGQNDLVSKKKKSENLALVNVGEKKKKKKIELTDESDGDKSDKNKKKKRTYEELTDDSDDAKNKKNKKKKRKKHELSTTDESDEDKSDKNKKKKRKKNPISESETSDDSDNEELLLKSVHIGGPENGYISKPHIEFSAPIPNTSLFVGCGRRPDTKPKNEFQKMSNVAKESYKEKLKHRGYVFYLISFFLLIIY